MLTPSVLAAACPTKNILLDSYHSDISRQTSIFFSKKGIDLCELQRWQQSYPIIFPWDPSYDTLRQGYNRAGQFYPKMIVLCERRKHAQWALLKAKDLNISFSIRSGGHSTVSFSLSNDFLIDLSRRDYINFDSKTELIQVGASVRNGQLADTLGPLGYVLPSGTCQNVAVAGLSMGGGIGFLERKFGLTLDSMVSATIILADGKIVTADESNYSDLFWAIRGGGGGSLGLVTDFTFKVYKVSKLVLFEMSFPFKHLEKVMQIWQTWAPHQTFNLTTELDLYSIKDKPETPISIAGEFIGKKRKLNKILEIFDGLYSTKKVWYATIKEAALHFSSPYPAPFQFFRNLFIVEPLNDTLLEILNQFILTASSGVSIEIDSLRGQIYKTGHESTAFAWRDAHFWMLFKAYTHDQRQLASLTDEVKYIYKKFLDNNIPEHVYVNFHNLDLSKDAYPKAYWGKNAHELSLIKTKYDPTNFFQFQQSIPLITPSVCNKCA
jgi:hypothetical protein